VGTTAAARVTIVGALACALAAPIAVAHADTPCTRTTAAGGRYAACFDLGNRLYVAATTDGYGGGIALRQIIRFDDEPDLIWKLEHVLLDARGSYFSDRVVAAAYSGRFLRHARDGHLVLPFSVDKKIFLPFDIGADARVGTIAARISAPRLAVGIIDSTALIDLSRSESFRRRLCIGAMVRWQMEVQREPLEVVDQVVAPFSTAVLDAHVESRSGITAAGLRLEAGKAWSRARGWHTHAAARLSLERILIAINDRPLSLVLGATYRRADDELRGQLGLRFALHQRMDRRVVLDPLRVAASPDSSPP